MNTLSTPRWTLIGLLALALLAPDWASAEPSFSRIVVFGTSLSDPGNAFALIRRQSTPPYANLDALRVPDAPYAKGGHHFSNGATWIEQFARPLGLAASVSPAFLGTSKGASNYAVGASRAREDGINVSLSLQVGSFLFDVGGVAPADALYVLEMGGNDIRDALLAGPAGAGVIAEALVAIGANLDALYAAGARHFLVANVPNPGLAPAVRALDLLNPGTVQAAGFFAQVFNTGLEGLLTGLELLPGVEIARLDLYQKVGQLVADPQAFGLSQVESACITPGLPPFTCQAVDDFLFWDGVHPTAAVHAIFAQETAFALTQ
ncbi:SGNH/GDSL hydrolase family protein [Pseudomonas zhanjiangensis]|uniref:SGNH/GDSL hydrolase family protein n=1 Tax=Pseudomonas zhanjiangensis TaxID=3239015 RepID=A0ABV3YN30_9PSED